MNRSNKKKHVIYNRMHMGMLDYYRTTYVEITPMGIEVMAQFMHPTTVLPKFVVVRKKDSEEVGVFNTIDEANEIIEKAKRGKKAALMIKE